MAENSEPLFDIDLGSAGRVRLQTFDAAQKWIMREREFWSWIEKARSAGIKESGVSLNWLKHFLDTANSQILPLEHDPGNNNAKEKAASQIKMYGETGMMSTTPIAVYIHKLYEEEGPVVAASALMLQAGGSPVFDQQPNQIIEQVFRGATALALFKVGVTETATSALSSSAESIVEEFKAVLSAEVEAYEASLGQLKHTQVELVVAADAARSQTTEKCDAAINDVANAISELKNVENAYIEHMKLGASEEYWGNKAEGHQKGSWMFAAGLLAYAGVVGILLTEGARQALSWVTENHELIEKLPTQAFFLASGLVVLTATVVLWIARIQVRLYLSERHLMIDANERIAMARTYNALVKEGKIDEKERAIVLGALFRSSADGIVKEDSGVDMSAASVLARILDQK